jgi:hypothetical protein
MSICVFIRIISFMRCKRDLYVIDYMKENSENSYRNNRYIIYKKNVVFIKCKSTFNN